MKGAPFTQLCRQFQFIRTAGRADLHTHTTCSDGTHTPASVVERALSAGLQAVAITDHDTLAAVAPARDAAGGRLEVIAGVELTAALHGSEVHLLGYFIRADHVELNAELRELRISRRARLLEMAGSLRTIDGTLHDAVSALPDATVLGRRHLARLLIERGHARSLHEAFARWLSAPALVALPKRRVPVERAIALVRAAGGVASWAHPPASVQRSTLAELKDCGLQAVECVYPWPSRAHGRRLEEWAAAEGLAITGGSDSHDPGPRAIGVRTVDMAAVDRIRQLCGRPIGPLTSDS